MLKSISNRELQMQRLLYEVEAAEAAEAAKRQAG